jgi:hypothetical protein
MKKYGITTAMKPLTTLRRILVHPKDKCDTTEQGEVVYSIPCKSCQCAYIGETGRQFKVRLEEHKKDVESHQIGRYTRNSRKESTTIYHKSAITDHANTLNHIIDWEGARIIEKESSKKRRQVKEAIWIRRTEGAINRDSGSYELSHIYDTIIPQEQHHHLY